MSQIERACKALEKHVSIIKYLKENYPIILSEWKNKAGAYEAPADTNAITSPRNQLRHDYADK